MFRSQHYRTTAFNRVTRKPRDDIPHEEKLHEEKPHEGKPHEEKRTQQNTEYNKKQNIQKGMINTGEQAATEKECLQA